MVLMKALIIGTDENGHEETVRLAFIAGGGVNSEWRNSTGLQQDDFDYAIANDFNAIIYSYSGVSGYVSTAESNPSVMLFMPSRSYNTPTYEDEQKQLVITEHYPTKETDSIFEFSDSIQSADSYSNGYICGQLFDIAEQCSCTLVEARIRANATLDTNNIINVTNAVAYEGEIKLTVGDITAIRDSGFESTITLERIIDATSYDIGINGSEIITGSLINNYTLPGYDKYKIKYRGVNGSLVSDWSEEKQINYRVFENLILV